GPLAGHGRVTPGRTLTHPTAGSPGRIAVTITKKLSCCALLAVAVLVPVATVSADPANGSLSGVSRAPANGSTVHTIVYNGGEQADFSIAGDGDTALNIVVKDGAGNVVTRTRGPGDRAHVTWHPRRTATYYVYVVNDGSVYNEYSWRAF